MNSRKPTTSAHTILMSAESSNSDADFPWRCFGQPESRQCTPIGFTLTATRNARVTADHRWDMNGVSERRSSPAALLPLTLNTDPAYRLRWLEPPQ